MGVKSQIGETDAQGRPTSDSAENGQDAEEPLLSSAAELGPFAQNYELEKFETSSEDVDQMLSLVIAIANIVK